MSTVGDKVKPKIIFKPKIVVVNKCIKDSGSIMLMLIIYKYELY